MPKVRTLNEKRADYWDSVWRRYELLYEGGHKLDAEKGAFLPRRPRETPDMHTFRLTLFTYRNLFATTVDEIVSATLQAPIAMNRPKDGETRPEPDAFYTEEFFPDPTGSGKGNWNDLFLDELTWALVKREAYIGISFDDAPDAKSLAEQDAAGGLRARVECVSPERVINLKRDRNGLEWVMLFDREKLPDLEKPRDRLTWTRIDRKAIEKFVLEVDRGKEPDPEADAPSQGAKPHRFGAYRELGAVPIVELCFESSLWLGDKIGLLANEELRKRNGLNWYEEVASYPQPYHKGEGSLDDTGKTEEAKPQVRGAAWVIELEKEGDFGYAEPAGTSLEHLTRRLEQLERDFAKAIHATAAATGPQASAQIQSAESKVRDSVAKRILCERYAKKVRDVAVQVMDLVSFGRQDTDHVWQASGADRHDLAESGEGVDTLLKIQAVPDLMQSKTFRLEMASRTAQNLLLAHGVGTETLDQVAKEYAAAGFEPPEPPLPEA